MRRLQSYQYLEGEDLDRRIARSGPMEIEDVARIADEMLAALGAIHDEGMTHRDLRPSNVFLTRDDTGGERVALLGSGVSMLAGAGRQTSVGQLLAPFYLAPEQTECACWPIDRRTDLWAAGAILYEMLAGRRAFEGDTVPAILHCIRHERPAPLELVRPDAPPALCALVAEALEVDVARRPPDAASMRRRLRTAAVVRAAWRPLASAGPRPLSRPRRRAARSSARRGARPRG